MVTGGRTMNSGSWAYGRLTRRVAFGLQAALVAGSLVASPASFAGEGVENSHQGHATPVSNKTWQEALIGQTKVEEAIEGRAGRSEKVELQHHRLMRQMQQDAEAMPTSSGGYKNMSLMHQYMGQDGASFLLASDMTAEPVAARARPAPQASSSRQTPASKRPAVGKHERGETGIPAW